MSDNNQDTQNNSSDGTLNTEAGQKDNGMIPRDRFNQVNEQLKEAQKALDKLTRAQQEREQQEALNRGEHEKIINELRPQAESAKRLAQAMEEIFALELQGVPEDMRDLIPGGDVSTRLTWLKNAKTRGLFTKPTPPITDAGAQGTPSQTVKLTDEERAWARQANMTDEQYIKFKST